MEENKMNMQDYYSNEGGFNSKNEAEIPRSISSNKSYKDFYKVCKAYYHELRDINSRNENISKDDMIVLNDLIKEINGYSTLLMKSNFLEESKKLLKVCIKIVDFLLK